MIIFATNLSKIVGFNKIVLFLISKNQFDVNLLYRLLKVQAKRRLKDY